MCKYLPISEFLLTPGGCMRSIRTFILQGSRKLPYGTSDFYCRSNQFFQRFANELLFH